ncbi:hypothetical protein B0T24DRAFT_642252 [Lasiosphaeria ovina]|uniref:Uncharacterized protein n=1 Tax=Lasiosphaeria ovina TaxID=92902 RepID=A0AAE0JUE9_9PEZI|nr:hypothetical protein B0T24DRAFT_644750 [Lasiosphaeria ovina]KAK3361725.1 hypothetical protein B0T24DRAFT_642252 [Lasiosphaeria ovina]
MEGCTSISSQFCPVLVGGGWFNQPASGRTWVGRLFLEWHHLSTQRAISNSRVKLLVSPLGGPRFRRRRLGVRVLCLVPPPATALPLLLVMCMYSGGGDGGDDMTAHPELDPTATPPIWGRPKVPPLQCFTADVCAPNRAGRDGWLSQVLRLRRGSAAAALG